jgi:hypothetical protein
MRKYFFLVAVGMILLQPRSAAQLCRFYGVKVGATFAEQYFRDPANMVNIRRIPGFSAAVFAEWFNTPHFSIVSQLELTQRGVITDLRTTEGFESWRIVYVGLHSHLHYLSVPFLAKWSFTTTPSVPYLLIGPRVDYLLWYSSDIGWFDGLYKEFKKTLLGGSVGLGWSSASLLPITLIGEFRYNFDFINSAGPNNIVRNDALDVWIGYAF